MTGMNDSLCAFSMYATWWNKPLSPKEPIIVKFSEWTPEVLAFMYMSSEVSGQVDEKQIKSQTSVKTLFASLHVYAKTPQVENICLRCHEVGEEAQDDAAEEIAEDCGGSARPTCQGHTKDCEKALEQERKQKEAGTAFLERRPRVHAAGAAGVSIDPCDLSRHRPLEKAILEREAIGEQILIEHAVGGNRSCIHFKSEQLLAEYSRNWSSDELLRDVGGLVVGMVLWLANFLYGGIHAAAWNDHLPSAAEKWLWRASASYLGLCGGLWVVLNFVVSSYQPLNDFWEHWMDGNKG